MRVGMEGMGEQGAPRALGVCSSQSRRWSEHDFLATTQKLVGWSRVNARGLRELASLGKLLSLN
jgi:hypothetical protein